MVKTVYLAHPYVAMEQVQKEYQPQLEALGLTVINPFIRPEQSYYEAKIRMAGGNAGLSNKDCADIVDIDLKKIQRSDAIVAFLVADNSVGTLMEIFYCAHVLRKPVYAYAPREREATSPWIREHAMVFSSVETLLKALGDERV